MRIYTRTGDDGTTSLFAGGRTSKSAVRVHAYGTVDELNAVLGMARAFAPPKQVDTALLRVQSELFSVGADLATPLDAKSKWIVRVASDHVAHLENEIDQWQADLPELRSFILPGGTQAAAALHQGRTTCRRAERWAVMLAEEEAINQHALSYLNRLSDWLFVAARMANWLEGATETTWVAPTNE